MASKEIKKKSSTGTKKSTNSVKTTAKKDTSKKTAKSSPSKNVVKKTVKDTTKDKKSIVATTEVVKGDNVVSQTIHTGSKDAPVVISIPKTDNAQNGEGATNIVINLTQEKKKRTTTSAKTKKKKKGATIISKKEGKRRLPLWGILILLLLLITALLCVFLIPYFHKKSDVDKNGSSTPLWEITADGKYMYFGSYPQRVATADELATINTENADENGYYTDTNGNKYKKLTANPYTDNTKYTDNTTIESTDYYFKVEKIKWRILKKENNTAILFSESILDSHEYGDIQIADISEWLNVTFISNFTSAEQSIMLTGTDTTNKVFLMDRASLVNEDWFDFGANDPSEKRAKQTTDYARAKNTKFVTAGNGWWLYSNADNLGIVADNGCVHDDISLTTGGIAPTITIDLKVKNDTTTTYTVKHYQQKLGNWKTENLTADDCTVELEYKSSAPNISVTPNTKVYTGFTAPSTQTITIAKDGSTVVEYFYTRKSYNLTLTAGTGIATFDANGTGCDSENNKAQYGAYITLSKTLSDGYTFGGFTSSDVTISNGIFTMSSQSVTIIANATENTYIISFNSNGGTGEMVSLTGVRYTESKTLTANAFAKTGYNFAGWSTSSTATTAEYANNANVSGLTATNGATVTLYAVWSPVHDHSYSSGYNSTTHWQECSVCHTTTTAVAHTFESGKCVCGFVEVTQGLRYEFVSGETIETPFYRVMGYKDGETPVKHVKIPATYNDGTNGEHPVLEIIGYAFTYEKTMESVTFAGDIDLVDGFYGCENLESVTFCGSVKKIGTFGDTPKLTSITLPESLIEIDECAFAFSGLTSINIPASVEILGPNPFAFCFDLTTITIDSENANYYVLNNYIIDRANKKIVTGLTYTNIPTNSEVATSIGGYAFAGVTETTLKIPNNITTIGDHAFYACALTSVELPSNLTEIKKYLFSYCINLTNIVIPEDVVTINESAFDYCTSLTTIYYGGNSASWTAISCTSSSLNDVLDAATIYYYSATMPQELNVNAWRYVEGVPTPWPAHTAHNYDNDCDTTCNTCGATRTITHNYGTTYQSDDNNHWQECSVCHTTTTAVAHTFESGKCVCGFVEVTQNLAYTFVQATETEEAYYKVTGIGTATAKHIKIPATYNDGTNGEHPVKSVAKEAFKVTSETSAEINILSVTFLENMETIGESAFNGCYNMTSLNFSNTITAINMGAFTGCMSITTITLPNGLKTIGDFAFLLAGITSVNIPASVEIIGANPFMFCENLTAITIDSKNTNFYIKNNCLIDETNKKIIIGLNYSNIPTNGEEVTTIGYGAFAYLTGVANVKIPNNITILEECAFELCGNIVSVEIPVELTQIVQFAFDGCSNLTTVYYAGTQSQWGAIEIGTSGNSYLTDATIYYYSATEPTTTGNYWHYVAGVPTPWSDESSSSGDE